MKSKILVTGAAGFIGSSISKTLVHNGYSVIGVDNYEPNYDPKYKLDNINNLLKSDNFLFYECSILDTKKINKLFFETKPSVVIHLAALTGVRASLTQPKKYEQVNVNGTEIIFEAAGKNNARRFIFSSSSSVYGNSRKIPFTEGQKLYPVSPYAKTKKQAENLLTKLKGKYPMGTIILRFFSVYGPHGRPDMAPYLFTEAAIKNKPIEFYGNGDTARDYTYIDDVTNSLIRILDMKSSYEIINIGNSSPVQLKQLTTLIEKYSARKIKLIKRPRNTQESKITYANISKAKQLLHWQPGTTIDAGMKKFITWYTVNRHD